MNEDDLYNIIGRMYVDISNTQKVLEMLRKQTQEKDQVILELEKSRTKDE
mgnify:FL=1|tara:strand:+ start:405 stop:554 length:150 start_codon:yes stop_codon:yes gene_type:complete